MDGQQGHYNTRSKRTNDMGAVPRGMGAVPRHHTRRGEEENRQRTRVTPENQGAGRCHMTNTTPGQRGEASRLHQRPASGNQAQRPQSEGGETPVSHLGAAQPNVRRSNLFGTENNLLGASPINQSKEKTAVMVGQDSGDARHTAGHFNLDNNGYNGLLPNPPANLGNTSNFVSQPLYTGCAVQVQDSRPEFGTQCGPAAGGFNFDLSKIPRNTVNNTSYRLNLGNDNNVKQCVQQNVGTNVPWKYDPQEMASIVTQVVSTMQQLNCLPDSRGNNLSQAQEAITFSNKMEASKRLPIFDNKGGLHPVDFLQQLEYFFKLDKVPFEHFKHIIANQFKGETFLWSQVCLDQANSFQGFKNAFLQQFWHEDIQAEVQEKLRKERYETGSFVQHFLKCMSLVRHITPPYSESQSIRKIARLFPPNVSSSLISTNSISEALERLRQADSYYNIAANVVHENRRTSAENTERLERPERYQRHNNFSSRGNPFGKRGAGTDPKVAILDVEQSNEPREPEGSGNEPSPHE